MKSLLSAFLLVASFTAFGQTTITLTENLVLTETLVISEDVTYEGNGFRLICEGCDPAIRVENGAKVHFENVNFVKSYASWMRVSGIDCEVTWRSPMMTGHIRSEN